MYFAEFDSNGYALVQYSTLSSSITNTETVIIDDLTNLSIDVSKVQVLVDDEVEAMAETVVASSASLLNGSILDFNVIEYDEIGVEILFHDLFKTEKAGGVYIFEFFR